MAKKWAIDKIARYQEVMTEITPDWPEMSSHPDIIH